MIFIFFKTNTLILLNDIINKRGDVIDRSKKQIFRKFGVSN